MTEWLDPLAIVGVALVSAFVGMIVKTALTRQSEASTRLEVDRMRGETDKKFEEHQRNLQTIEREFVSRRELDEKLANLEEKLRLHIDSLKTEIVRTRDLIGTQGAQLGVTLHMNTQLLHYVLTGKRPELPASLDGPMHIASDLPVGPSA